MPGGPEGAKCPGCSAPLPPSDGGGVLRCIYCGTEVRLGQAPPQPAPFPAYPPQAPAPPAGYPQAPGAPPAFPPFQHPAYPAPAPLFQPPKGAAAPRRRFAIAIGALSGLLVLAALGGIAYCVYRVMWSKASGTASAKGGALGTWTSAADDCHSGHAFLPGFFGADVTTENGARIRVLAEEQGGMLLVWPPGAKEPVPILRTMCSTLDIHVEWGSAEVNDVKTVEGRLGAACTLPDGSEFSAKLEFEACH